jgi:hypothetical protein
MNNIPRFSVGQTVYIESRFEGVLSRKIVSVLKDEYEYSYELDKSVVFHKDGLRVGSANPVYDREDRLIDCPCSQDWLMLPGDRFFSTHPVLGGRSETRIFMPDPEDTSTATLADG